MDQWGVDLITVHDRIHVWLVHTRFLAWSIPAKSSHPSPGTKPNQRWHGRNPHVRTQKHISGAAECTQAAAAARRAGDGGGVTDAELFSTTSVSLNACLHTSKLLPQSLVQLNDRAFRVLVLFIQNILQLCGLAL